MIRSPAVSSRVQRCGCRVGEHRLPGWGEGSPLHCAGAGSFLLILQAAVHFKIGLNVPFNGPLLETSSEYCVGAEETAEHRHCLAREDFFLWALSGRTRDHRAFGIRKYTKSLLPLWRKLEDASPGPEAGLRAPGTS